MADHSTSSDEEQAPTNRGSGAPIGLDPVSPTRFGEIIDGDHDTPDYNARPQPNAADMRKRDQFSRATWVMIVFAGVFLGVAMAMIAAG